MFPWHPRTYLERLRILRRRRLSRRWRFFFHYKKLNMIQYYKNSWRSAKRRKKCKKWKTTRRSQNPELSTNTQWRKNKTTKVYRISKRKERQYRGKPEKIEKYRAYEKWEEEDLSTHVRPSYSKEGWWRTVEKSRRRKTIVRSIRGGPFSKKNPLCFKVIYHSWSHRTALEKSTWSRRKSQLALTN